MRLFLLALATLLGCTNSATVNVSTTAPQLDGASRYVGGPRWERPSATTVVIEPYDVPVVTEPGF